MPVPAPDSGQENKQEKAPTPEKREETLTPEKVVDKGKEAVQVITDGGKVKLLQIVKDKDIDPDDEVVQLAEEDLIEIENEAGVALGELEEGVMKISDDDLEEVLGDEKELLKKNRKQTKELPPPIPVSSEAASKKSTQEMVASSSTAEDGVTPEQKQNQERLSSLRASARLSIDELKQVLGKGESPETGTSEEERAEQVKQSLVNTMGSFHDLFGQVDVLSPESEEILKEMNDNMSAVLDEKKKSSKIVSEAFSDVFHDFSEFIDEAFVMRYIEFQKKHGQTIMLEDAAQYIYGRTPEEIENIKTKNRKAVVERIKEMKDQLTVTLDDVEGLHALNNKGIVPTQFSKVRSNPDECVTFGSRFGILPQDVEPAMQSVVDGMNHVFDARAAGQMSRVSYELAAAKVHNDILDIHPFMDRNGSTSLLVLEMMMTRDGVKPSVKREKDYYKHLRKTLRNNPAAVAVVGYEQYMIKNEPGHFQSEDFTPSEDLEQTYELMMQLMTNRKKQRDQYKQEGKERKKLRKSWKRKKNIKSVLSKAGIETTSDEVYEGGIKPDGIE